MIKKDKIDAAAGYYTRIGNAVINDRSTSLAQIGLYCVLSSLPESWNLSIAGLLKLHKCTRYEMRKALNGLLEAGYLEREAVREGGRFRGYCYRIHTLPHAVEPEDGKPEDGKPEDGIRTLYNNTIYNETINKKTKKKDPPFGVFDDVIL